MPYTRVINHSSFPNFFSPFPFSHFFPLFSSFLFSSSFFSLLPSFSSSSSYRRFSSPFYFPEESRSAAIFLRLFLPEKNSLIQRPSLIKCKLSRTYFSNLAILAPTLFSNHQRKANWIPITHSLDSHYSRAFTRSDFGCFHESCTISASQLRNAKISLPHLILWTLLG